MTDVLTAFLYHEANLLDEQRWDQWLELFQPDAHYWMPCELAATERTYASSIINDDMRALRLRILRLQQPNAHAIKPLPSACRLVSNVVAETTEPLLVRSKLLMHEFQRREYAPSDDLRTFAATVRHVLVPYEGSFRIAWKRVDLIDAHGARSLMPTPL